MIEIQLPPEAAVSLLADQVRQEIENRKKLGQLHLEVSLDTISPKNLRKIIDIAIFDIIILLPVTLLTEKSNLEKVITTGVHDFARAKKRPDLRTFVRKDAKNLILAARKSFDGSSDTTTFQNN